MGFAYMKATEEQLLYYQFPKFLLEIPLSQNARIVYCLLYDRARISRKNQWVDEQGRVYGVFPIEKLSQKLENTSDYLMLGLFLICMKYDKKVCYKVLNNNKGR